jgi:formylglycine-generating enzyme required for sulfatase activity
MKYSFKLFGLLVVGAVLFSSCEKHTSNSTGWNYNDERNGGFEYVYYDEQETGPGLVFIEGGTFSMGRVEQDVLYDWNNIPRRITVSSFYMDQYEVRNIDYLEYLYWLRRVYIDFPEIYYKALPDTLVWRSKLAYNEPYVELYFRHPAYAEYPVVGVNYEQAVKYCEWRTDRVNEMLYIKINKISYDSLKNISDIPKYVEYRLPTIKEWEFVANQPYSEKTLKQLKRKKNRDIHRHNLNFSDESAIAADMASITAPVSSYWPNQLDVYNIIGNVAELSSIKGKAKGGSWKHIPEEVNVGAVFEYDNVESWLGFRCICDMHIQI